MQLYIELWKPRPAWDNLSREQRKEVLGQLTPGVERMKKMKVELIGFAVNDQEATDEIRYMAVWKMPNLGHVHMLAKAELVDGWSNYFDITHVGGPIVSADKMVDDMLRI